MLQSRIYYHVNPNYLLIDIPRLLEFYKLGWFDFDKTEKFYDFEEINQANADSVSGKTIKPVLIIDKDYRPEA